MSNTSHSNNKLKVFISSKMIEMYDIREYIAKALDDRGIHAWIYEAHAGARPGAVIETSLREVESADIYVGLFWKNYGKVTIEEYNYARTLGKPCFIYIREQNCQREKALEDFLKAAIYDLHEGVSSTFFMSSVNLGKQIADDIMKWLVERHREMTADIQQARISKDEIIRLQSEIKRFQAASSECLPQGTVIDYLAQQTRAWFRTLNYSFDKHDIRTNEYFEYIINIPKRRGHDRILVQGIEGEGKIHHIRTLRQAVDTKKANEGWLVAVRRVGQAARSEIEKEENHDLLCYTFDELLDENADFSGYLDWLESEVKRRGIDRMYVPLACTKEEFDPITKQKIGESQYYENNGWIDGYIDRWQDDPSKEHISILGEFGTGKTWFALHYAWMAIQRYRDAKVRGIERPRLPLVIPLRDYAKAVSVESLFSEFFFRKYEIPLSGYSAFEQLNRMGKLLLIFDGFDEMAAKVDRQKMINNFWELARAVVPGAKVILTCRTEHFPEAREGRALLNAELQASTAKLSGDPPQFEVLELNYFNSAQIRKVLSLRAEPATVEQVMNNHQLLDLARRPLMSELILEALPDIKAGSPIDLSHIYLYAVRRKMERDIREERTFTSLADKLYFLCELSWEMLSTGQMSLNYRLFPDRLRRLFGPVVQDQKDLDHWHYDMMGQAMLIRNADGDYAPAHRSLLEFFVAYKFAAELGVLASDFIELAQEQSHLNKSISFQNYTWSSYFRHKAISVNSGTFFPCIGEFVAEEVDRLTMTVGKEPLTKAILDLIDNMLVLDEEELAARLLTTIAKTSSKVTEEVGYIGGNAATLLARRNPSAFNSHDLSWSNLSHAYLSDVDFTDCDLRGANLQNAQLLGATLKNADLRSTDLTNAQFIETRDIKSISFSSNGDLLAINGGDQRIHIWDVSSGRELQTLPKQKAKIDEVIFDKFGYFIGAMSDHQALIWNAQNLGLVSSITSDNLHFIPNTLCFSPINPNEVTIGGDKGIATVNLSTGSIIPWEDVPRSVHQLQYLSDGQFLAINSFDSTIVIFDSSRRIITQRLRKKRMRCIDFCFSKNGLYAAVLWCAEGVDGTGQIDLYSIGPHAIRHLRSINHQEKAVLMPNQMSFLHNDRFIAIIEKNSLCIFDRISGKSTVMLNNEWDDVSATGLSLSPDASLLASSSLNATINFWDVRPIICYDGAFIYDYSKKITKDPVTWPDWWQKCKRDGYNVDVPEGMIPNPNFGKRLRGITQTLNCDGVLLMGAKGLNTIVETGGEGKKNVTLGEWLKERGANLGRRSRTK